jgi:adenylate cyclase
MATFRTTITFVLLAFITAVAAILLIIQVMIGRLATQEAATAYMDATTAHAVSRLEAQIALLSSPVKILSMAPSVAGSDNRSEVDPVVNLFKNVVRAQPLMESLYVGYENGCWLQVRDLTKLDADQRRRLEAPANAAFNINLVWSTDTGAQPMRRVFEDEHGNKIAQVDLWNYGYDARRRSWYRSALDNNRAGVSPPYPSFSTGAPMITFSAPLRGSVRGVVAADMKLDTFSEFIHAHRPGEHGAAWAADSSGRILAHPDFARLVEYAQTHPAHPDLPKITEIRGGPQEAVLRGWDGRDRYEGTIDGFFFRLNKFSIGDQYDGYLLLLALQDDFLKEVTELQIKGLLLALIACAFFLPVAWIFGGRMSGSLKRITAQAEQLQVLASPDAVSVRSYVKEIDVLGTAMTLAQRAIWSFAHFVPKEMVKGVIDGSISTELGGIRRELSILFTDVQNFTTIAEGADPDILMHQTSRYFTALTDAFLAEGGTIDKYIGDAVMVFWNAPHLQPDHVERACRAALEAKAAGERLNRQFAAEGLPQFITRFGVHAGEAVVGNVGSTERMDYTVLGNSVNLASRLEGLNKQYGTTILVSGDVYTQVNHLFQLKSMGTAIAKGMSSETPVYELIGPIAGQSSADGVTCADAAG